MRRAPARGRLPLLAAFFLLYASGAALAAGSAALAARPAGLPASPRACSGWACQTVSACKNLLLDGVHLGQRCLREAISASLEHLREVREDAPEAPADAPRAPLVPL